MSFFRYMVNLQPNRRIPDAWFIKLTFSLTITLYLTKTEDRNTKSPKRLSYIALDKGTLFDITKVEYIYSSIFFGESFWYNSNEFKF